MSTGGVPMGSPRPRLKLHTDHDEHTPITSASAASSPEAARATPAELQRTLLQLLGSLHRFIVAGADETDAEPFAQAILHGLFRLLHALEPQCFPDDTDLTQLQRVRAIASGLENFFQTALGTTVDLTAIKPQAVVNDAESTATPTLTSGLFQLLQVVLLCAIHSQRKDEVVNAIMSMNDHDQSQLMHSINDSSARYLPHTGDDDGEYTMAPIESPRALSSLSTTPRASPLASEPVNGSSNTHTPERTLPPPTRARTKIHRKNTGSNFDQPADSPSSLTATQSPSPEYAIRPLSTQSPDDSSGPVSPSSLAPNGSSHFRCSSLITSAAASALQSQLTALDAQVAALMSENRHLRETASHSLAEEKAIAAKHEHEVTSLEEALAASVPLKRHAELLREHGVKANKAAYDAEEHSADLAQQLAALEAQHASQHVEAQKALLRCAKLEREWALAREELEVAQVKLEEAARADGQVAKLKAKVEALQSVRTQHSTLEESHAQLALEVDSLRALADEAEHMLRPQNLKLKATQLQLQQELREANLAQQTHELAQADLQAQLQAERELVAQMTTQLAALKPVSRPPSTSDADLQSDVSESLSEQLSPKLTSARRTTSPPQTHDFSDLTSDIDAEDGVQTQLATLQGEYAALEVRASTSTAEATSFAAEVATLQQQVATMQLTHSNQLQEYEVRHLAASTAAAELAALREAHSCMDSLSEDASAQAAEQIASLTEQVEQLRFQKDEAQSALAVAVAAHATAARECAASLESAAATSTSAESLREAHARIETLNQDSADAATQITSLNQQVDQLRLEKTETESAPTAAVLARETATRECAASLESAAAASTSAESLLEVHARIEALNQDAANAATQIDSLTRQLDQLRLEKTEVESALAAATLAHEAAALDAAAELTAATAIASTSVEVELASLRDEAASLQAQLSTSESALSSTQLQLTESETKLAASQRACTTALATNSDIEGQLSSLQESYTDLHEQYLASRQELQQRDDELDEAHHVADEQAQFAAELQAELERAEAAYRTKLEADTVRIATLQGQLLGRSIVYEHELSAIKGDPSTSDALHARVHDLTVERAAQQAALERANETAAEWKQRHRDDIQAMNMKLLTLQQERERQMSQPPSPRSNSRNLTPLRVSDSTPTLADLTSTDMPSEQHFPPLHPTSGANGGPADKHAQMRSRLSAQSRELLDLKKQLLTSNDTITSLEAERVELEQRHERELCKAFDALSALQGAPLSASNASAAIVAAVSPKHSHALSAGEDFTLSASKVNSYNAQKHLESTVAELRESQQKLHTLLRHYKRLETKLAQSETRWQQICRGPVAPPITIDAVHSRQEILEREHIRVNEMEILGREQRLMASAFHALGMYAQPSYASGPTRTPTTTPAGGPDARTGAHTRDATVAASSDSRTH